MTYYNRRQFLGRSAAGFAGAAAVLGGLTASPALAANTQGYKAMVCIMLKGGLDHNDVILPKDQDSYDALREHRTALFNGYNFQDAGSSRNINNLLKLNPSNAGQFGSREFGLAPEMSGLHDLFEQGEAAIIGGVGPLIEPLTRDDFETERLPIPRRLFSHNDQQSTWMALGTEGTRSGWGGAFADAIVAADRASNPLYASITASSPDVFLAGQTTRAFKIPSSGSSLTPDVVRQRWRLGYGDDSDAAREAMMAYLQKQDFGHDNLFRKDVSSAAGRGLAELVQYSRTVENAPTLSTAFPGNGLGGQLGAIANTIHRRGLFNIKRQVFYASIGGFDTHDSQAAEMPVLQSEISSSIKAFRDAMIEAGVWDDVVVFTMSDFGRTIIDNGDGTDHGWGGHHFVAGGSVRGGQIYGDIASPDLGGLQYTAQRGRLIPTTSVEQYAASLGAWFGLDSGELAAALPNLSNFDNADLGFMAGSV